MTRFSLLLLLTLCGCDMAVAPWKTSRIEKAGAQAVTCMSGADCEQAWKKARRWAKRNATYSLLPPADDTISTAPPAPGDPTPAFTISRARLDGERYAIGFTADCENVFGCVPPVTLLRARFVSYMLDQPLED